MKSHLTITRFILLVSTGLTQSPQSGTVTASQKAELSNITNRVFSGDYNALYEVTKMPAPAAVPYLRFWTGFGRTPQQYDAASSALRQVEGYADYLQQDMAAMTSQGRVPENDFQLLAIIGTPEAAEVVAPYLFDFTTITPQRGDVAGDSNLEAAVYALTKMKLSGSPSPFPLGPHKHSQELVAWQKWAIAKGFVPKEWSSRIGPPVWMVQFEQAQIASGMFPSMSSVSEGQLGAHSSPFAGPLGSASVQVQSNLAQPLSPTIQTKAPGPTSATLIAVAFIFLIICAIFALKKKGNRSR